MSEFYKKVCFLLVAFNLLLTACSAALPKASVQPQQSDSMTIYIGGRIKKPGLINYENELNVARSIFLAGGLKNMNANYHIFVFRKNKKGGIDKYKINLARESPDNKAFFNFKLTPYDIVYVMQLTEMNRVFGTEI